MAELLKQNPKNVPPNVEFYRNAEMLKGAPNPKDYGFRDVGRAAFAIVQGIESILIISIM